VEELQSNWYFFLGTHNVCQGTEEEAAEAYDIAAIKFRGLNAVTNFELSRYNVDSIISRNLPIGTGVLASGRSTKQGLESASSPDAITGEASTAPPSLAAFSALPVKCDGQQDYLSMLALQHHQKGNLQGLGFGLYSSGVNMDFMANSGGAVAAHCYANGASNEQYQQQQQEDPSQQRLNSCSSIPLATPIAFSGPSYESSMTPGPFGYCPNVAAFHQTPIYGMEWFGGGGLACWHLLACKKEGLILLVLMRWDQQNWHSSHAGKKTQRQKKKR
jgi:AP2-like factor, ANT lineage